MERLDIAGVRAAHRSDRRAPLEADLGHRTPRIEMSPACHDVFVCKVRAEALLLSQATSTAKISTGRTRADAAVNGAGAGQPSAPDSKSSIDGAHAHPRPPGNVGE